jgi:heme/copper-type cytochrome/quinol oxidase subunit 3
MSVGHILGDSCLPFYIYINLFFSFSSLLLWFKLGTPVYFFIGTIIVIFIFLLWSKESRLERNSGRHNYVVIIGLKISFIIFLFTEVIFFFRIFWLYFDRALTPIFSIGGVWPPLSLLPPSPMGLPLLGTCILLVRGVTLTWAHIILLSQNSPITSIGMTIILAIFFLIIQYLEYRTSSFTIRDSIYGRVFYFATGFHGFHVIVGILFIFYCLIIRFINIYTPVRHNRFEIRVLYWHFVDVVWLFLYLFVYCWGF